MLQVVQKLGRKELVAERKRHLASISMSREEHEVVVGLGGLSGTQG